MENECDHQWADYGTLKSGDNPTIEIEACVRCGVQRKKQRDQPLDEDFIEGRVPPDLGCDQAKQMDPAAFRRAYGLSDKPQDKWTPETIKALWKATTSFDDNLKSIADAHNAALATAIKDACELAQWHDQARRKAEQQLAAERER